MSQGPEAEISSNSQGCWGKQNNGIPELKPLWNPGVSAALEQECPK